MTLLVRRGFREDDFAHLHPGGKLGKGLMRAHALMHAGDSMPLVSLQARMRDVIEEMSHKKLGMTCVVDAHGQLAGVVTDGDLRRGVAAHGADFLDCDVADVMTRGPVTVSPDLLAVEALKILEDRRISSLIVAEAGGRSASSISTICGERRCSDAHPDPPAPIMSPEFSSDVEQRAVRLKLLLFDVDGVLTDGRLDIDGGGHESKRYHIRDGTAFVWARQAGLLTGLLSARSSPSTSERARQLGIPIVRQGADDKLRAYDEILAEHGLSDEEVAYMGDDLLDLPVLPRAGLSRAPADAVADVRTRVHWVSPSGGGGGAVRDLVEQVLRARRPVGRHPRPLHRGQAPTDGLAYALLLATLARAARRSRRRQGLGALQAAGRPLDRSAQGPRVAALHAGPEFPGRQPARSGDRGAEPGRQAGARRPSRST